jgi:RNA polymerase sigma factor (sigma-70 family)
MKKLKNYTEEQILEIFQKISKKISHKYKFAHYTAEDLQQECFIFLLEAIEKYDEERPLENFLYVHLSNRMYDFKRDNYTRIINCDCRGVCEKCEKKKITQNKRKNIASPIDIYTVKDEDENRMKFYFDPLTELEVNEVKDRIERGIPLELREDYLKYLNGVKLTTQRKRKVEDKIREILDE